jgi:hypothetical protein
MRGRLFLVSAALAAAALAYPSRAAAQAPAPGASGHWTGTIETPGQPLQVEVDLKPAIPPAWQGVIAIPAQNMKGFALEAITVDGKSVSFVIPKVPGEPTFKGTLSDDGTTISGDFSQGGGTLPFKLTRGGDAVFPGPPAKSTAITKDVEGTWNGTLAVPSGSLRLMLKLAGGADGATGSITSVDQGGVEIPIATITQTGAHLELELPSIAGTYSGDLKDGKLVGTWRQGPGTLPLEFTRSTP